MEIETIRTVLGKDPFPPKDKWHYNHYSTDKQNVETQIKER